MKQPPAEGEVASVGLKVIAESLGQFISMVLQADPRCIGRGCCEGDDAGKVVPTAEQVELDASEDGEQGEDVDQSEGSRNGYRVSAFAYKQLHSEEK